jgi:hypothetical protein
VKNLSKINQLIQERIDIDAFETWYADLSFGDQQSFIKTLVLFAYQAGVTDATWEQASSLGGFAGRAISRRQNQILSLNRNWSA